MKIEFKEINSGKMKAAGILTHGDFIIKGINVIDGDDGIWVALPSRPYTTKDGNTKYQNIVWIEDETRRIAFQNWVLKEYRKAFPQQESAPDIPGSDENIPF